MVSTQLLIYPRRCVFFGTTNEAEFLRDKTGNRRFWPIDCGINTPTKSVFNDLPQEVQQVWAEALVAWRLGERLYLTGDALRIAETAQEEHSEQNSKEGIIREFLERDVLPDWEKRSIAQRKMYWQIDFQNDSIQKVPRCKVCAAEIWCECLGGDVRNMKRTDAIEINGILQRIPGWDKAGNAMRISADYGVQKGFVRAKIL